MSCRCCRDADAVEPFNTRLGRAQNAVRPRGPRTPAAANYGLASEAEGPAAMKVHHYCCVDAILQLSQLTK